jgi:PRTRC genetic system protein B
MPNERTELMLSTFSPQLAIMVYKCKTKEDYYLESHQINDSGQIMEGKPLLQETMQGIVDVFFDERQGMTRMKGMLPENILSFELKPGGDYKMMWHRPAEIRVLHTAPQLKLPVNKTWVPAMVYVANRKNLSVCAVKTNSRPKENTRLYKAPFFNVSDDGRVCLGNAQMKKPKENSYAAFMQYWEDLFWLSEFTHLNDSGKTKTDMHKVWLKLLKSKTKLKWNDVDELIAYQNKSFKHLL